MSGVLFLQTSCGVALLGFLVLLCIATISNCYPIDLYPLEWRPQPNFLDECLITEDIKELCQRCAKQTKSDIVYPMCCEAREAAREWCDRYTNFGLQERHILS